MKQVFKIKPAWKTQVQAHLISTGPFECVLHVGRMANPVDECRLLRVQLGYACKVRVTHYAQAFQCMLQMPRGDLPAGFDGVHDPTLFNDTKTGAAGSSGDRKKLAETLSECSFGVVVEWRPADKSKRKRRKAKKSSGGSAGESLVWRQGVRGTNHAPVTTGPPI